MNTEICKHCDGTGYEYDECETCGRDGWVYDEVTPEGGTIVCPDCEGESDVLCERDCDDGQWEKMSDDARGDAIKELCEILSTDLAEGAK